jgi:hypothetical protein
MATKRAPRETLRRLTVTTTVAAVVLNALLFVQTSSTQLSAGDVNNAILAAIGALLPGSVRAPGQAPIPTPSPPVAVTGGS